MIVKNAEKIAKSYVCNCCDLITSRRLDYEKHLSTDKHKKNEMIVNDSEKNSKIAKVEKLYICNLCDFNAVNKNDFRRHLNTYKHKKKEESNIEKPQKTQKSQKEQKAENTIYKCECGKAYKYDSGYYRHKKTCNLKENTSNVVTSELVLKVLEQNKELIALIPKNGFITTICNNNNTINNNQKLNINVFLNEQCKDAISMDAFVDSIDVTIPNLLITKEKGLVEGLSNIIIENMSKLPITQRPIHCTDVKRETIYIKNDTWEKDTDQVKTKEAIKKVSCKQIKGIKKWTEANPNFMKDDKLKEEFNYLVKHSTDDIKDDKIIKNLCKTSYINEKLIE